MSPGHAVPLCRCLPDFVVSTEATTRCRRERIPTATESAIRARFVRDSFHSLITGFPRPGNAVIRQCAVVDLASFARSGLLHRGSLLSSVSSIASRRFLCAGAPWVAHCTARARRRYLAAPPRCARNVRALSHGPFASPTHASERALHVMEIQSELPRSRSTSRWPSSPHSVCRAWREQVSCANEVRTAPGAACADRTS
jgi:hypothetical protein